MRKTEPKKKWPDSPSRANRKIDGRRDREFERGLWQLLVLEICSLSLLLGGVFLVRFNSHIYRRTDLP